MSFQRKYHIWVFFSGIWKKYCHIWDQRPSICLGEKLSAKIKILKFGTKNAWFGYFGGWNLKIMSYMIEINILEFVYLQNFVKKWKYLNLGLKNALFWYFWARILKSYCHIWNQHPLFANFCEEARMSKFGTKNALLRLFLTKNTLIGFFGLEFENKIVIFEISTLEFVLLQSLI